MKILAFESSCDDTCVAIVEDGRRVLSSCVSSQTDTHALYGGVVPEIASRMHTEAISRLCRMALSEAGLTLSDIDAIAVTYAPGLIGALLVGLSFAKGLASTLGVPLIPVHHVRAHVAAAYLAFPELEPPFVALACSGGTTAFIHVEDYTRFRFLGGTRDDAAGEAFDKVGRVLGLPYPAGAAMDRLAADGNDRAFEFPHPTFADAPLDCSFSGLKTAVINSVHNLRQKGIEPSAADLSASFCRTVSEMLVPRLMRAAEETGCSTVCVGGGVAANSVLRRDLERACRDAGLRLCIPPLSYCGDNAAMVGCLGYYEFLAGHTAAADLNAYATMSLSTEEA
ncbi:MAG: tRNA (adenosine(37)-N6)-threonylcarbamoyltransferase complex transferase subunit TsaD [Clostridia bacterium]|nr:tRNA (adenosine(37)-N6)-threonylcarbamoyltransferase complex transferase subunit TsaD [Clostridia bacterium]